MRKLNYKRIILICLGVYAGFTFISQQITISRQNSNIKEYTTQLQQAQEKNNELQDEIKLSSDDSYVEKLAREKLGLVKQGESPVIDSN